MIQVGDRHWFNFTFDAFLVMAFADLTGDDHPIHVDPDYAAKTTFKRPIVHGAFLNGLISRGLGRDFPGAPPICVSQDTTFEAPVHTDETVRVEFEVTEIRDNGRLKIATRVVRQDGTIAVVGSATVQRANAPGPPGAGDQIVHGSE